MSPTPKVLVQILKIFGRRLHELVTVKGKCDSCDTGSGSKERNIHSCKIITLLHENFTASIVVCEFTHIS